jgi:predicted dienelactone hydrolase
MKARLTPLSLATLATWVAAAGIGMPCAYAAEPQAACAEPPGRFPVGYRVLDFKQADRSKGDLTVAVWYPTTGRPERHCYGGPTYGSVAVDGQPDAKGGPYPLLVFSHGYGGSGLAATFFTEPLAARGWIVAAPDHHDEHSAVRICTGAQENLDRRGFFARADQISKSGPKDRPAYCYRLDEMKLALDGVLASETFGPLVDRQRIAVGGHSFGGFTSLGLCGTIPERHDARIRGVLLFSTGAGGYLFTEEELRAVKIPLMLFLGEREREQRRGEETMADLADKVYRNLPPPKYLVEIKGATHFSFNNRFSNTAGAWLLSGSQKQFDVIARYSTAFLERHVAGRKDDEGVLDREDSLVSRYRKQLPERTPP